MPNMRFYSILLTLQHFLLIEKVKLFIATTHIVAIKERLRRFYVEEILRRSYKVWLKRNGTDVTDCAKQLAIGNQQFYSVA